MGRRRVFVTGMGIFSPLGGEIKEFWNNLSHGQSGVHQITKFDPTPSMNLRGSFKIIIQKIISRLENSDLVKPLSNTVCLRLERQ
jgi:3-oxoacyl-(acyl-carrier-protein) synthase